MGAPPNVGVAPGNGPGFYFAEPDRLFWRYYFAGQALAGLVASPEARREVRALAADIERLEDDVRAELALEAADALLARLEGEEGENPGGSP